MEITPKNAVGLWRREPRGLHQPAEDGARPERVERAAVKQAVAVGLCLNGVKGAHLEREDGGEERDVFGLLQNGERLVVEGRGVGGGDTLANQWVEDDGLEELREDEGVGGVVEVRDDAELCVKERLRGREACRGARKGACGWAWTPDRTRGEGERRSGTEKSGWCCRRAGGA